MMVLYDMILYSKYDYFNAISNECKLRIKFNQSDKRAKYKSIILKLYLSPPHAIKGQAIQSNNGSLVMNINKI